MEKLEELIRILSDTGHSRPALESDVNAHL